MSNIITFFVAPRERAAAGADGSPAAAEYGNFDAGAALIGWESWLTGRSFEELVELGRPEFMTEAESVTTGEGWDDEDESWDDEPVVYEVSGELREALGAAGPDKLEELTGWWAGETGIDPGLAAEIVQEVVTLARRAAATPGEGVYCQVS